MEADSFCGWLGGKTKLRPTIISVMPKHETYVEVFGGSATVFFGKPPEWSRQEFVNDLHGELVNLMKVLSGTCFDDVVRQEFIGYVRTMPAARAAYQDWKNWGPDQLDKLTPAQRAFRFYYCVKKGFSSVPKGGYEASPISSNRYNMSTDFDPIANRFRERNAQIECLDFRRLIEKYNRPQVGTLFFCFPPNSLVRMHDETWKPIESVNESDVTWGGKKVLKKIKRDYAGPMFKFKVQGSPYDVRATADHPFLAVKGRPIHARQDTRTVEELASQMKFCTAQDLRVGDYLCIPVGGASETIEGKQFGHALNAKRDCPTRRIVNGYVLSRIKEIGSVEYVGPVFNLDVDGDSLICVDNVVSHNCDPPYFIADGTNYYDYVFAPQDHQDLRKCCDAIQANGNNFLITYDDLPEVIDLYKKFRIYRTDEIVYNAADERGERGLVKTELFITNYDAAVAAWQNERSTPRGVFLRKPDDDKAIKVFSHSGQPQIGLTRIV